MFYARVDIRIPSGVMTFKRVW